jgi:predicted membrane channel-forming protein YqfA (hemolysin III family)
MLGRDNPYLLRGFVVGSSLKECFLLCFRKSNEFWNIYTHLIPAIIMAFLTWRAFFVTIPGEFVTLRLLMTLFSFCGMLCFSFSVIYHCMRSLSVRAYTISLTADVVGIALVCCSGGILAIYCEFHCDIGLMTAHYILSVLVYSTAFGLVVYFVNRKMFFHRSVVLALVVCHIPLLLVHKSFLVGFSNPAILMSWRRMFYGLIFSGGSLLCKVYFIPDRFFPKGTFDFGPHSHVWFHILSFLAVLTGWIHVRDYFWHGYFYCDAYV